MVEALLLQIVHALRHISKTFDQRITDFYVSCFEVYGVHKAHNFYAFKNTGNLLGMFR